MSAAVVAAAAASSSSSGSSSPPPTSASPSSTANSIEHHHLLHHQQQQQQLQQKSSTSSLNHLNNNNSQLLNNATITSYSSNGNCSQIASDTAAVKTASSHLNNSKIIDHFHQQQQNHKKSYKITAEDSDSICAAAVSAASPLEAARQAAPSQESADVEHHELQQQQQSDQMLHGASSHEQHHNEEEGNLIHSSSGGRSSSNKAQLELESESKISLTDCAAADHHQQQQHDDIMHSNIEVSVETATSPAIESESSPMGEALSNNNKYQLEAMAESSRSNPSSIVVHDTMDGTADMSAEAAALSVLDTATALNKTPSSRPSSPRAATTASSTALAVTTTIPPLPDDLRAILTVVAKTGTCPWLPWSCNELQQQQLQQQQQKSSARKASSVASSSSKRTWPQTSTTNNSSSFAAAAAASRAAAAAGGVVVAPPRKKLRNGIIHHSHHVPHSSSHHHSSSSSSSAASTSTPSSPSSLHNELRQQQQVRKRPLSTTPPSSQQQQQQPQQSPLPSAAVTAATADIDKSAALQQQQSHVKDTLTASSMDSEGAASDAITSTLLQEQQQKEKLLFVRDEESNAPPGQAEVDSAIAGGSTGNDNDGLGLVTGTDRGDDAISGASAIDSGVLNSSPLSPTNNNPEIEMEDSATGAVSKPGSSTTTGNLSSDTCDTFTTSALDCEVDLTSGAAAPTTPSSSSVIVADNTPTDPAAIAVTAGSIEASLSSSSSQQIVLVSEPSAPSYICQRDAFRIALELVLDHFYNTRGGYTLSWAEKRRNESDFEAAAASKQGGITNHTNSSSCSSTSSIHNFKNSHAQQHQQQLPIVAKHIFQQRKQRLLNIFRAKKTFDSAATATLSSTTSPNMAGNTMDFLQESGPPFTIQRVAEVLIAPERYYTQTHKLCNCLEKLLLITSSVNAFGGITGGDTSQSRLEERELAALAEEQDRLQFEFRQRRRKRASSSSIMYGGGYGSGNGGGGELGDNSGQSGGSSGGNEANYSGNGAYGDRSRDSSAEEKKGIDSKESELASGEKRDSPSQEMLEAAARASLRTKFDHVGIDPHSSAVGNRDVRAIADTRGLTNSPPPPSLGMVSGPPGMALGAGGHGGLLRHSHTDPDHPPALARAPSPILFSSPGGNESSPPMGPMHSSSTSMQLLQMHHAAAMAGVSPFELVALNNNKDKEHRHLGSPGGVGSSAVGVAGGEALSPAPTASMLASLTQATTKDLDLESRSSASSDVDSESDVSFDDSASDRSDGSDSGAAAASHYEPFSAARAMALNRIQQQQQRLQNRILTTLYHQGGDGNSGGGTGSGTMGQQRFAPGDTEYQSGDSVDSLRAEDSGGSDSSSSDVVD